MVAFRPEVEKFGLVLPIRNGPHSGWPLDAQPLGSRDSLRMSPQPIGVFGQPRACAIGRGIAMTSGATAIPGVDAGTSEVLPPCAMRWRSRPTQVDEAGDQTSGCGPASAGAFQPRARAAIASPDDLFCRAIVTHLPCTLVPSYSLAKIFIRPNFSGEETMLTVSLVPLQDFEPPRLTA